MSEKFIAKLLKRWERVVFPFTCVFCRLKADRDQDLCNICLQSLGIVAQNCRQCAQNLEGDNAGLCGRCLTKPPPFAATRALFWYEGAVTFGLLQLKFHGQLAYARVFGELMAEHLLNAPLPDLILPVPLHPSKLQERGFNQAVEIGRAVSRALQIPLELQAVERIRATASQMTLPRAQRQENLKGAFRVCKDLSGLSLAVLDDVMTTGATVTELTKLLKAHGAARVEIWCVARVK